MDRRKHGTTHSDVEFPMGHRDLGDAAPSGGDVVFRVAAACFAIWVVVSAATSPVASLRASWWPVFLVIGGVIAAAMLTGAFLTLTRYLRQRWPAR